MKNYFDQKQEFMIACDRLKSLKEKRDLYFGMTQPKGVAISEDAVITGMHNDVFATYVCKIDALDKAIDLVEKEIELLGEYLRLMEDNLRQMKGDLERIFVLRYIDGLSVEEICYKMNYSRASVYRKLSTISRILKIETK